MCVTVLIDLQMQAQLKPHLKPSKIGNINIRDHESDVQLESNLKLVKH
jgi:hypothetical protein